MAHEQTGRVESHCCAAADARVRALEAQVRDLAAELKSVQTVLRILRGERI